MTMSKDDVKKYQDSLTKPKSARKASDSGDAASVVRRFDIEQIQEKYEFSAKVVVLEEGQGIEGIYVGPGTPVEARDPESGEMKSLPTHEFDVDGVKVKLIESHQLKAELPPFIGMPVVVIRGATSRGKGGRQVTEYLVGKAKAK